MHLGIQALCFANGPFLLSEQSDLCDFPTAFARLRKNRSVQQLAECQGGSRHYA